jgi:hypothetical protein
LKTAVYPFELKQKEEEKLLQYKNLREQKIEVIRAYHGAYEKIITDLELKSTDYAFLKARVTEIYHNYFGLYHLDAEAFYGRFIKEHPLVILAMLANSDIRPYIARQPEEDIFKDLDIKTLTSFVFLPSEIDNVIQNWGKIEFQSHINEIKTPIDYLKLKKEGAPILILNCITNPKWIGTIINSDELKSDQIYLPFTYIYITDVCKPIVNHVKSFSGETANYWKDVQPKGNQFLIIKMEKDNFIRNAGKSNEELNADDVNGKFPILNGIDYKSDNANHQLIYMGV